MIWLILPVICDIYSIFFKIYKQLQI
jgi:hypothetical protein